jgi:hypothetical protein
MKKLDIKAIKQVRLKDNQFFAESSPKTQIYLHHTAGNGNAEGVSRYWNSNETRIGTAFVIGEDGTIVQCFSSKHWAWHLGIDNQDFSVNGAKYTNLNKSSVGIEVCNWGYLTKRGDKFYNYAGGVVKPENVTTLEQSFKMIGNNNDQLQMFMKAVTNNSLSERDLLLSYSIGSFYNELNIFLKQNKKKDSR